jgi:hypothetical protein
VENEIFDGGPPSRLEAWLRLRKSGDRRTLRLAIGMVAVAWLPLVILTALRGDLIHRPGAGAFLQDFAVHARYLIAMPLLIIAEAVCIPRLSAIARQFMESDLVLGADRGRFEWALTSTRRLRDSNVTELAVIAISYVAVTGLVFSASQRFPAWQMANGNGLGHYSPAGWWHLLISLPLLLMLLLGWVWRLLLWTRLLWRISHLNLRLLASHPDHAAGIMFTGYSVRAWALPAMAPSVIAAGTIANSVVHDGVPPMSHKLQVLGLVVCIVLLFTAPLLAFSRNLLAAWRRGIVEYGALAERVGHVLESKWLEGAPGFPEDPMETGAFSATTDLYQIVSNVYAMKFVPLDVQSVIFLAAMTLLPFVPVLLISEPLDVMLQKLASFLV